MTAARGRRTAARRPTGRAAAHARLAELLRSPLYSEQLGIRLGTRDDREAFKWFLASTLFGARIGETIAANTYRAFERHGLLEPGAILVAGQRFLVATVMSEGGYVRYDNRKSAQILRDCEQLLEEYGGSVESLHARADDAADLERRLEGFFGVGPVTVNIFLRELRPWWEKADPMPLPRVTRAAKRLGIDLGRFDRKSEEFARLEAGLVRTGGGRASERRSAQARPAPSRSPAGRRR